MQIKNLKKKKRSTDNKDSALTVSPQVSGIQKSGTIYLFLAFFFGFLGVHNFYAGYVWKGIIQLLMTLFSSFLMFIPLLIVFIWVFLEICFVKKDAQNVLFEVNPFLQAAIMIMYLFSLFSFLYFYIPSSILLLNLF